jgi:hypothetical protein
LINETPFFSNSSPVAKKVEAKLKEKFDRFKFETGTQVKSEANMKEKFNHVNTRLHRVWF